MEYIPAKTIVTKTKNCAAWFGIDYNMNIYRGCSHGCIYCDSRSDCYHVDHFDTVKAKENALLLIRDDLRRKVRKGVVGTGAMSDPYNPFEKELKLTRNSLELINAFGFGAAIATKSSLLARDIDILRDIKEHSPVLCKVTVTAADDELSRKLEPHVSLSSERFELLAKLSDAGIFSGILMMPVLPFIEDNEDNIKKIVSGAREAGAKFIYAAFGVTLRDRQREWYFQRLEECFPGEGMAERYAGRYGNQYNCTVPGAKKLWELFKGQCEEAGILYDMKDIIHTYRKNYELTQLNLFDI